VLVRDDDFADALAAGPLAADVDAPLLLTPSSSLSPTVLAEVRRALSPGATVYLVGGDQALHPAVEAAVSNAGFHAVRIEGATRADTAVAIAEQLGNPSTVFEVRGDDFADGLAATPAAIGGDAAILFTDGDQQAAATATYLSAHHNDVRYAVGGPAAHADPAATSLSGADRYATDTAVAARFFASPAAAVAATAAKFPDALTGGVLAGRLGAPILLAAPTSPLPAAVADYLRADGAGVTTIDVVGGPDALADSVIASLRTALRR
jgi:putative cell wall-binding protein